MIPVLLDAFYAQIYELISSLSYCQNNYKHEMQNMIAMGGLLLKSIARRKRYGLSN